MGDAFASPPLLNFLCVLVGAGLLFSPHIWLISKLRGAGNALSEQSLARCGYGNAMAVFFTAVMISFSYALVGEQGVLWFEAALLLTLIAGGYGLALAGGRGAQAALQETPFIWLVRNAYVFGFMLASFALIQVLLSLFSFMHAALFPSIVPIRETILFAGALWIGALYYLHLRALGWCKSYDAAFHKLLWPIVLGLFFFMLPLLINEIAHSEDFHEMLNRAPRLQRA